MMGWLNMPGKLALGRKSPALAVSLEALLLAFKACESDLLADP